MAIEIVVPRLGWSMEKGTFSEWLKKDGDQVNAGEMLFVLEGEKATQEIESFDSGILRIPPDAPRPGDTVSVGQLLGYLVEASDAQHFQFPERPSILASIEHQRTKPSATPSRVAGPGARRLARELGIDLQNVPTPDPTGRVLSEDIRSIATIRETTTSERNSATVPRNDGRLTMTPRARRLARVRNIDCSEIRGTGRNGRIRERDVIAFAAKNDSGSNQAARTQGKGISPSKIRKTIAQRMLAGVHQTAPVTLTTKVDAASLVAVRSRLKNDRLSPEEMLPSYTDIIVKLVSIALTEQGDLNSCWHDDSVVLYQDVNVAIAVDTDFGLMAPVVRSTASLSLAEIANRSRSLAESARNGGISEDQLAGGTFTVTNLGNFGVDAFTPIINLPQTAILGIGRIRREPVVLNGECVPGATIALSLTFDHRAVDGAPAARWLERLSHLIQNAESVFARTE